MRAIQKYSAKAVFFDSVKRVVIDRDEIDKYRSKGRLKLPDDITRFDSQHEFKVYLELCRMYGAENILRQYPTGIFYPGLCYPKGKVWKVDFAIQGCVPYPHIIHYVEAKGAFLPEFAYTLATLEQTGSQVFDDLYIVFGGFVPTYNKVIASLSKSDFGYRLFTFKELEQLAHLPLPL